MNEAYLCLGGNLGNREENLERAKSLIYRLAGRIGAESAVYETAAWGNTRQPGFLNQVIKLETELDAHTLMQLLLSIEKQLGRTRDKDKYGARIIDIDILLFNNEISGTRTNRAEDLSVPHPRLHLRKFVLIPLAEIAGNTVHPVLQKTINELLDLCEDELEVRKK